MSSFFVALILISAYWNLWRFFFELMTNFSDSELLVLWRKSLWFYVLNFKININNETNNKILWKLKKFKQFFLFLELFSRIFQDTCFFLSFIVKLLVSVGHHFCFGNLFIIFWHKFSFTWIITFWKYFFFVIEINLSIWFAYKSYTPN